MIKIINLFRKIEDPDAFQKQFVSDLLPKILQAPGIIGVKITTMLPMSSDMSQDIEGIQLVIENCFESQEDVDQVIQTPVGKEFMEALSQLQGELSVYIGEETTYSHRYLHEKPIKRRR